MIEVRMDTDGDVGGGGLQQIVLVRGPNLVSFSIEDSIINSHILPVLVNEIRLYGEKVRVCASPRIPFSFSFFLFLRMPL